MKKSITEFILKDNLRKLEDGVYSIVVTYRAVAKFEVQQDMVLLCFSSTFDPIG